MDPRDAEREYDDHVIARQTLSRTFEDAAERHADSPAQAYKGGVYDRSLAPEVVDPAPDGGVETLSYDALRDIVRTLAAGFRDLGVTAGDRVGVFAHTRMEWAQCDLAVLAAGGAVTTVYASSSPAQIAHLLGDSGAVGVVVENDTLRQRVREVESDLDDLEFVATMDTPSDDTRPLSAVYDRGRDAFDPDAYQGWIDDRDPDDLASLIYTSGTTGTPKGVALTHRNFHANLNQSRRRFGPRPDRGDAPAVTSDSRHLSFLPLAHVLERLSGHFLPLASGAQVCYAESPDTLREDFGLFEPTSATSVPRVYEKLYDTIREQAADSPVSERVFEWATRVGRAAHTTDDPGIGLRAAHALADTLVFSDIRDALGGEIEFFISGGGSLSPELCALFHGMGLPILEGYGLTETSPVLAVNPYEDPIVGTIGPPVTDTELTVDETIASPEQRQRCDGAAGELLARGPQVFDGYWGLPDATDAAFVTREGKEWFRTGDVVELRPDGYVRFLERAKQLLTLSTGKNVAPGPIEDAFAASPLVAQAMVVGDGQKFVSAILVPNFDAVSEWAASQEIALPDDRDAICRDERVRARIQSAVDDVNTGFEPYERIKQFRLVATEFTEANDLLTPTMKKKRHHIRDRFADAVGDVYDDSEFST
ncbi:MULTISPECIES: long-chain fatty acid--CoA ligase [Halobacterium]|uniref:AMP-dependent synthetase/ligase n=1 Tax=Halobacterium TaxID=2239 RepID=UPI0019653932|nr:MULTISPECIES: long-chain fatty acid--CoA ligase [Halobacterium]MCF2239589.1 long-chain fatty acid--CoA ligase [Halobacterium salinarum]MDL0133842.1 long-chain fatty acid--CoA ligase [Halobacterium salinarum]QRY22278.1 long-chain fatty acid--CoA ligase [Halobacterium sp. GSL-19]QRY24355.1 long-chain fatty acid--CoA ligase [Halobacterium sp. BOL4-2]